MADTTEGEETALIKPEKKKKKKKELKEVSEVVPSDGPVVDSEAEASAPENTGVDKKKKKGKSKKEGETESTAGGGSKKEKKKGRKKKKKEPRCPIKRRKKAIKRKCTDMLAQSALLNTYFTCHNVSDMLKFRKFKWKKKKKNAVVADAPAV